MEVFNTSIHNQGHYLCIAINDDGQCNHRFELKSIRKYFSHITKIYLSMAVTQFASDKLSYCHGKRWIELPEVEKFYEIRFYCCIIS